jgi:hypothetical protein
MDCCSGITEDVMPSVGDYTVCLRCGEFMRFTKIENGIGTVIPITEENYPEMDAELLAELGRIRRAAHVIMKK